MTPKKIYLPIFLSAGTLFAFILSFSKADSSELITTATSSNLDPVSSKQQKVDQTAQNPQQLQKLSVLPLRCIACGRCFRIDPAHFAPNPQTGKSMVISSSNLNSRNLAIAINNCPVQAITLQ